MPEPNFEYLGDGAYADYSTGVLWLHANSHDNPTDKICIDGDVLVSLFKFIEKSMAVKITVKPASSMPSKEDVDAVHKEFFGK
jgi:hypothetical protein